MSERSVAVHLFVAAAVASAVTVIVSLVPMVRASDGSNGSSYVPIVPCRLVDTRVTEDVGARHLPMGPGETATFQVWGTNGHCSIPAGATGIASNVTAVAASQDSYITLFPADSARPKASNLNPAPRQPPTPNQVTVGLSAQGAVAVFNNAGSVDVIIDVVGYSTPAPIGAQGPIGPTGPAGPPGPPSELTLLGAFTPTQLVKDAVLTCGSPSGLLCSAPLINGINLVGDVATRTVICSSIAGTTSTMFNLAQASVTQRFRWNPTTSRWELTSGSAQTMTSITC